MTTSLAQQLKKLAVPQTSLRVDEKKRTSFLFDPKEAANLDKDTVYCLGVNGLEELVLIDDGFKQFESNLFDVGSKSFVRSMHTREVNENLDATINNFFLLASPYILLRPAHKALEWLVYRFQVHLYNKDALIACFLPYHGTNIFVRAVQLLDIRNCDPIWEWLLSVQTSGTPLAKSAVINYAVRNVKFLKFICDIVNPLMEEKNEDIGKRFEVMFAFYASCVVGVIRQIEAHQERMLICLLPYILRGLNSPLIDLKCSSLMMISQLANKRLLSSKLCASFVKNVIEHAFTQIPNECTMCLLAIYQSQNYDEIRRSSLRRLLMITSFMDTICELDEKFDTFPFIRPLLLKSLQVAMKSATKYKRAVIFNSIYLKFCKTLVSSMKLDGDVVRAAIMEIIQLYKTRVKAEPAVKQSLKPLTGTLLSMFEMRYPDIFDEIVEESMHGTNDTKSKRSLRKLLTILMEQNTTKFGVTTGNSLYLNLNHAQRARRKAAVQRLLQRIKEKKETSEKFIEEALTSRLHDDYHGIPLLILNETEILTKFVSPQLLTETLKSLLEKKCPQFKTTVRVKMEKAILTIMGSNRLFLTDDNIEETFFIMFPFIFPMHETGVELAQHLCTLDLFSIHPLLKELNSCFRNPEDIGSCFESAINGLCTHLMEYYEDDRFSFLKNLIEKCNVNSLRSTHLRFICVYLLHHLISLHDGDHVIVLGRFMVSMCSLIVKSREVVWDSSDSKMNVTNYLHALSTGHFSSGCLFDALSVLITNIKIPPKLFESAWCSLLTSEHKSTSLLLFDIFTLIVNQMTVSNNRLVRKLLKVFVRHNFSDSSLLLNFLGHFWTNFSKTDSDSVFPMNTVTQSCALVITRVFLKASNNDMKFLNDPDNSIIPLLLVALNTPSKNIRILVLNCVEEICQRKIDALVYKPLITKLVKNRSEIEIDAEQLTYVVSRVLQSEKNESVLNVILQCIVSPSTPHFVRASLLCTLRSVDLSSVYSHCYVLLTEILSSSSNISPAEGVVVDCILNRLTSQLLEKIKPQTIAIESLTMALNSSLLIPHLKMTCQQAALKLTNKKLFGALDEDIQPRVFFMIVDLQVKNQNPEITALLSKTLKKIFLDSVLVISELRRMLSSLNKEIRPIKKRRLINQKASNASVNEQTNLTPITWAHVDYILEMVIKKKKINNVHKLIPVLFDLLKPSLESDSNELRKQMILECIHHCCTKMTKVQQKLMTEKDVNVDLLVQCLRISKDKQTHNHALILLGLMANLFPETVLHNVMAIFTFMGTNMLRQDDLYSFQIMERTTSAVVPAILSLRNQAHRDKEPVSMILRIFVDAFPDVPLHRRIPIFTQLLDALDAKNFLGLALAQLLELHVTRKARIKSDAENSVHKELNNEFGSALKFALDLCAHFSPLTQLHACYKIIRYLSELPTEKPKSSIALQKFKNARNTEEVVFDVEKRTPKELRHFQFISVTFVASTLKSNLFIEQISEVRFVQREEFEKSCKILLEEILQFSNRVARCVEVSHSDVATSKFWKTLMHRTYEVLDKVNALLPGSIFVALVRSLMTSDLPLVRHKSIELLNSRLQFHPDVCQESEISALCVLLDPLLRVIESDVKAKNTGEEESFVISQVALLSLKLLCRILGQRQTHKLKEVLDFVINVFVNNVNCVSLCGSSLLCLVEVCSCLRAHSIGSLHKFMPTVLSVMSDHTVLFRNELLLQSMITCVYRFVEILPHFLSPYLPSLVEQICLISSNPSITNKSSLSTRLEALRHKFSSLIPARVLLPSLRSCFDKLLDGASFDSLTILLDLLKESISVMDSDERSSHFAVLQSFFLTALDFRASHTQEPYDVICRVESSVIEPILTLVMKLSETSFRPMFFKIFSWATQPDVSKERCITLYHLVDKLTDQLKSLFLLFAGQVIQHAATLLDALNSSKTDILYFENDELKSSVLLGFVLASLHKFFLYDKEGFVNTERFDLLLNSLVDQIENQRGSDEEFHDRIVKQIAPCIAQFAEAAADDACWKQLNNQVLLKTRHTSPQIRIAALHCVEELNSHLEKDYLPLLPETIPFLAELMEDESTEVEEKCQKVVAAMESTLGEPLKKYF